MANSTNHLTGSDHPNWKGDSVTKNQLHRWVERKLGKPQLCEHCGTTTAKRFDWANKSQQYKRDLNDWIRLCTKCHAKYDAHLLVGKRFAGHKHTEETKQQIADSLRNRHAGSLL